MKNTHKSFLPDNASYGEMASPVGELIIITSPAGLHAIMWEGDPNSARYIKSNLCESVKATLRGTAKTNPRDLIAGSKYCGSHDQVAGIRELVLKGLPRVSNEKNLLATKQQLNEYFQGIRTTFDLPLIMHGTDFQKQVWQQLLKIPYGQTICYSEQATRIGDKNKARAVGMANGCNPIPIIVPCHRVIGKSGHLTGFAGGVDKKAYLLNLERSRAK
jgi:O-6-methylguanine DNA methyltransferase